MDHRFPYRPRRKLATHELQNQPTPLVDFDAFSSDRALVEALHREGGGWGLARCEAYGKITGSELLRLGFAANENPPRLVPFDRFGGRIDEVAFDPSYHRCMALARNNGLHSLTWTQGDRGGAQVVRSVLFYLHNQYEAGTACPTTMTHAAVPVLRHAPSLAEDWLPGILSTDYDPACRPAADKRGLSIGMGMTEKQGGSDVRSNTTRAESDGNDGFRLTGHKWFFSAPMSDAFIVLAQEADAGLSCFFLPRWIDDERNAINIMQLKDKLGDKANASSEVEFAGAFAQRIGEPGRGVATIIEMVSQTRLDCMLGSAALMRAALVQAIHHSRGRQAFGKPLIEQPLQRRVLADLALESEAAMALALRMARAFEQTGATDAALARLATPIGKYWICRSAPAFVNEAQECLGGAGYVETSLMPRLFRQSPLNSIWEGAGNIQCLDMLRALARSPASRDALTAELERARGLHPYFDGHCDRLQNSIAEAVDDPGQARAVAEDAAKALQAATLLTAQSSWVGDVFCDTRLGPTTSRAYGAADCGAQGDTLIERAFSG